MSAADAPELLSALQGKPFTPGSAIDKIIGKMLGSAAAADKSSDSKSNKNSSSSDGNGSGAARTFRIMGKSGRDDKDSMAAR